MTASPCEAAADALTRCGVSRGVEAFDAGPAVVVDHVHPTGAAHRPLREEIDLEPLGERVDSASIELQEEVGLAQPHLGGGRLVCTVELREDLLRQQGSRDH